jgi:flagellar assembly protein FliH
MEMDAKVRTLTYVQRFAGAKLDVGATTGMPSLISSPPKRSMSDEVTKHIGHTGIDVRLETRLIELERERAENERRHHEALAAQQQKAAEELAIALSEQKQKLEQQFADSIRSAVQVFEETKREYFAKADTSIVRLALGVAERVLNREAQLDPLLLRGPVRVALEEIQQNANCVLEVAADQAPAWERWFAAADNLPTVQVRAKEDAAAGYCRLEVGASSADLSVHAQLADIDRGFFDFLQSRAPVRDAESGS